MSRVRLERNVIELTGRRLSDSAVVNEYDGAGVRGSGLSELRTDANLIRLQTGSGIATQLNALGLTFANDYVCGNGRDGLANGIDVEGNGAGQSVVGTGLTTAYHAGVGVRLFDFFQPGTIQFNNGNAFTANASCGFANDGGITASALNNQWRGTGSCLLSDDLCQGLDPVTCSSENPDGPITLVVASLKNIILKGQTLRVNGGTFNAIAGNPLAGTSCVLGANDVTSQNCCLKKTKANVCDDVLSPPLPSVGHEHNCVAIQDALGVWRKLPVTSVTPTTIVAEGASSNILCVGEVYTQTLRVSKRDASGAPVLRETPYCRNL
jgi:hypothetical protein